MTRAGHRGPTRRLILPEGLGRVQPGRRGPMCTGEGRRVLPVRVWWGRSHRPLPSEDRGGPGGGGLPPSSRPESRRLDLGGRDRRGHLARDCQSQARGIGAGHRPSCYRGATRSRVRMCVYVGSSARVSAGQSGGESAGLAAWRQEQGRTTPPPRRIPEPDRASVPEKSFLCVQRE
jgi:hypothetical protein